MLDADAVHQAVEGKAEVWVITRALHAWRLKELLPPGLDVYGGAARIWWPMVDPLAADPDDHPLFTIFSPDDADRVTRQIGTHVRRRLCPAPPPETDTIGVVTAALENGAEITLENGYPAFAANEYLANGPIYKAWEAVREGQQVRVRVSGPPRPGRETIPVSLRPFAPDAWERLGDVYRPGMIVEGVVVELRDYGAFVELLPGARGLLRNARISRDFVVHPGDYVAEDERVVVHLRTLEPAARKAELSLVDVPEDADIQPAASLYPDGPAWLAAAPPEVRPELIEEEPERDGHLAASDADESREPRPDGPVRTPEAKPPESEEGDVAGAFAVSPDEADAELPVPEEPDGDKPAESESGMVELSLLAETVAAGAALESRLASCVETTERELARLRGQGRRLTSELRDEIAAAELRVLRLERVETRELLGDAQHEVQALRGTVADLRERLAAAERDREQLITQVRAAGERGEVQSRRAATAHAEAARAQAEAGTLRDQLDVIDGGGVARRFLRELHYTWTRIYPSEDDQRRYPFSEPVIGPAFLDSMQRTAGVSRERVLEVCAHVVSGRAAEINSLELHQLRNSEGGDAPQLVREDGATAWRVSLQIRTPSARRLHYWQRRDGRIELSKVGVHDDLAIV